MYKDVPCPECEGHGFHAKFGEYSVWSEMCKRCGGTGIVKEKMTGADRIRDMSDEELADDRVREYEDSGIYVAIDLGECFDNEADAIQAELEYLRLPAEED